MFKANRSHGQPPSSSPQITSERMRKVLRRTLDSLLLTVLAVVVIYIVFLAVKVSRGYSQTQGGPERTVRLQIVDGSGVEGMTKRVRQLLKETSDAELAVEVVESKRFDLHQVARSFLIVREEDRSAAEILARRLGLDLNEITSRPLENNRLFVTVTLVLGSEGLPQAGDKDS